MTFSTLVPNGKHDTDRAYAAVHAGYPAVDKVLPQLLEWLQDGNWPVAHVLAPFLASIGAPLAPHVEKVLAGSDDTWKYWVVAGVVQKSEQLARALERPLERIVAAPTAGEAAEGIPEEAAVALRLLRA